MERFNEIEDIFLVKSWLLSKIVDLFNKLMDLLFRKGGYSAPIESPPGYTGLLYISGKSFLPML